MAEYGVRDKKGGISHASSGSLAGQSVNSDSEAVMTAGMLNGSATISLCALAVSISTFLHDFEACGVLLS
jgi:hypothetical protein